MPQFYYKAKSGPQDIVTGFINADTQAAAVSALVNAGQVPIEVRAANSKEVLLSINRDTKDQAPKLPPEALVQFTRQLADLLDSGIPLLRAMQLLSRQQQFPAMKAVIGSMISSLQQGASLSLVLSQHPRVFSKLYVNTVKAAETSGQLPVVLDRLAQFLEQDLQMRAKVKSSLLYPAIIFLVGVLTIFILMTFVLPRLTLMYEDFDAELPLLTQIVMGISQFFAQYWWVMAAFAAGIALWLNRFLKLPSGKAWLDQTVMTVPLLRSFIENTQLSRFARTLGMLLESGVPVVAALESVTAVIDNQVLHAQVTTMAARVKEGMSLTQAVKASPFFPEVAADLIAVGQESGKLERGLYKLAAGCERKASELAQVFVTILGPAVLVAVVAIVGLMIVAILMPMLQMNLIVN